MLDGGDSDELVAQQLGNASVSEMSPVQSQYKDAIKRKLEEVGGKMNWVLTCKPAGSCLAVGWAC
jgi:hypothetical protein